MAANTSVPVAVSMSVAIPQTRLRRGGAATVSSSNAFTLPPPSPQYHFPPTPPNSISPSLPPVQKEKDPLDSDVDVEMVAEISASGSGGGGGAAVGMHSVAEAAGTITPGLLAKYHIPDILLRHGPLAIRHLTAHLISSIPGFSSIPPAKQRRLVVGALEGRGGGGVMDGKVGAGVGERVGGDVIFEKVGWGRWDARVTGQPPRDRGSSSRAPAAASTATMNVSQSYTGESGIFIQSSEEEDGGGPPTDLDSDMQGHNDDLDMSLDSSDDDGSSCSSSDDGDSEDIVLDDNHDDDGDVTDEEDWALIGAAMLRRQATSPITSDGSANLANAVATSYGSPWSAGGGKHDEDSRAREEREAVEALVKLSSI